MAIKELQNNVWVQIQIGWYCKQENNQFFEAGKKRRKLFEVFHISTRNIRTANNNHRKQYSQTTPINSIQIIKKNIFTDLYVVPFWYFGWCFLPRNIGHIFLLHKDVWKHKVQFIKINYKRKCRKFM